MKGAKKNLRREMDEVLEGLRLRSSAGSPPPALLLHSCCGPCSTSVIETLSAHFLVTVFYYNPNIDEADEYLHRAEEQRRLLEMMDTPRKVGFIEGPRETGLFLEKTKTRTRDPEGGPRCSICYALRLDRTAKEAAARGFPWFASTLSVSPLKDAERLHRIGTAAARKYGVLWLPADFKKKDGYRRSVELSARYGLYRQDYCGCSFSRRG